MAEPDDIAPLLMNQVEYAEHRGVSKQAIGKHVASGKIVLDQDGMIDVVAADRALGETRERINEPRNDEGGAASAQLTRARTAEAIYRARNAQLDYEEKVGNIVAVAGVAEAAAACGEQVVKVINSALSARSDLSTAQKRSIAADMLGRISDAFLKMATDAISQERDDATGDDAATNDAPTLFDGAQV